MLIELRCVTHGGAREEVVPGNLNSEPSRVKFYLAFPVSPCAGLTGSHVYSNPNEL